MRHADDIKLIHLHLKGHNDNDGCGDCGEALAYIRDLEQALDLTQHWLSVRSAQYQALDTMRRSPLDEVPEYTKLTAQIGRDGAEENSKWPEVSQAATRRHGSYLDRRRSALNALKYTGDSQ